MIVSFSVSNFRSFASEETLSLVASNRLSGSHDDHAVPIPDSEEKVLRAAVLYGANGAGKSNLFKALRYLRTVALEPRERNSGTGREPFRLGGSPDDPSTFDLQFIAAERLYRFGFKVDDERITEEWLFQVVGRQQRPLYERTTDENGTVAVDAEGLKDAGGKVVALATVGGPQNQSFLATVNATLDAGGHGEELGHALTWFKEGLILVGPVGSIGVPERLLDQDSDLLSFAGAFLKSASTGVDHFEVIKEEIPKDDPARWLSDGRASGRLLAEGGNIYLIRIQAAHEHEPGKVVRLDLTEESDGTRRLLSLLPALHHLRTAGAVYFIDEIDRSLHPILVKEFLEFFLKSRRQSSPDHRDHPRVESAGSGSTTPR